MVRCRSLTTNFICPSGWTSGSCAGHAAVMRPQGAGATSASRPSRSPRPVPPSQSGFARSIVVPQLRAVLASQVAQGNKTTPAPAAILGIAEIARTARGPSLRPCSIASASRRRPSITRPDAWLAMMCWSWPKFVSARSTDSRCSAELTLQLSGWGIRSEDGDVGDPRHAVAVARFEARGRQSLEVPPRDPDGDLAGDHVDRVPALAGLGRRPPACAGRTCPAIGEVDASAVGRPPRCCCRGSRP